jgi:ubiquinone/menaquinone biosynthesis C-methylase UbiE
MKNTKHENKKTSWEPVEQWYKSIVKDEGHYFHQRIILPGILRLAGNIDSILDLACGNGVLAAHLPNDVEYVGVDISPSLIKAASHRDKQPNHTYLVGDVTKTLNVKKHDFSLATIILAAQNLQQPALAFQNAFKHLTKGGKLIIVLNHPCFRVPRQSSWGVDETKKIQYRRIDRYYSTLEVPIQAHPGKGEKSPFTWSFHHPLAHFINWLFECGFSTEVMEEWCSDKESIGKNSKMENNSRKEIPLFLAIRAVKL